MPRLGRLKVQKVMVTLQTLQSTAFGKLPGSDYAKQRITACNSSKPRSAHACCAMTKESIVSKSTLFVKIATHLVWAVD